MPRTFHALLFSIPLMVLNAAIPFFARTDDKTSPAWIELPADGADVEWRDCPSAAGPLWPTCI